MQPAHLNAALACAQLERLTELVQKRNVVHDRWCQLFYAKRQRAWLFQDPGVHKPAWWLTAIRVDEFTKMLPQDLGTALAERGIETRPGFYPLSFYPHIASRGPVPVAEKLLRTLLILPSGPDITEDQQEEVMTAIGRITGAWS
jgi:perosamine synthetase